MDRAYIVANDIVDRYAAGSLTAQEEAEFEACLVANPELADELDLTNRLRLGLRTLEARGELESLRSSGQSRSRTRAWAIAASVVLVATGGVLVFQRQQDAASPIMTASLREFASSREGAPHVAATFTLAQVRAAQRTVIDKPSPPGIIELQVLPDIEAGNGTFRLTLERIDAGGRTQEQVAALGEIAASPSGLLSVFLDSQRLRPGIYVLKLGAAAGSGADSNAGRLELEIR